MNMGAERADPPLGEGQALGGGGGVKLGLTSGQKKDPPKRVSITTELLFQPLLFQQLLKHLFELKSPRQLLNRL